MSSNSVDSQIIALISSLPAGTNQFTALRAFFHSHVLPSSPPSYRIQLYVFIALYILMLLSMIISASMTFLRKGSWLLRLKKSKSGYSYIVVHANLWQIPAIIFLVFLIMSVLKNITSSYGDLVINLVELETLVWIPLFYTGWLAMWSVAVSFIIQREQSSTNNYDGNRFIRFVLAPPFVNIFNIVFLTIYPACVVPLGLTSARYYRNVISIYQQIDSQLALGEKFVAGGGTFSILQLQAGAVLESQLLKEYDNFTYWFASYFGATSVSLVILGALLLIFVYLNLTFLRHTIVTLESVNSGKDHLTAVKRTYSKMLITLISILTVAIAELISSINSAVSLRHASVSGDSGAIIRTGLLIATYSFTIPAVPIAIIVLIRSFDPITSSNRHITSQITATSSTKPYPRIDMTKYQKDFVHSQAAPLELDQVELRVFGGGDSPTSVEGHSFTDDKFGKKGEEENFSVQFYAV